MLIRFDPFREFDRLWETAGPTTRSVPMPMDAVRRGENLVVTFDLPGVDSESIDLTVERNQLTLTAERAHARQEGDEWLAAERPVGRFTRQLMLGENLDTDRIEAAYRDGVLEITIPVAEQARPRKVSIGGGNGTTHAISAESTESSAA